VDSSRLHLPEIVNMMRTAALEGDVVARIYSSDAMATPFFSEEVALLTAVGIEVEVIGNTALS